MAWRRGSSVLTTSSRTRGVSRRDFLKFCGSVAAMLGLSEAMVPQIAAAVEAAAASKLYARRLARRWPVHRVHRVDRAVDQP